MTRLTKQQITEAVKLSNQDQRDLMNQSTNDFLQVSPNKSECGACYPKKYVDCKLIHNYICNCICHSSTNINFCYICKEKICGALIVEDFNKIRHAECEKQCCHGKPLEVCKDCDKPMGVSNWKNHGIKYQYWDFFRNEIIKEIEKHSDETVCS